MFLNIFSLLILFVISANICLAADCPCDDKTLCESNIDYKGKEVFAFVGRSNKTAWTKFDWSKLTTLNMFGWYDPQLMCLAHKNKVRVVGLGIYPKEDLKNDTKISDWIEEQIQLAKDQHLDGINIDVEYDIDSGSDFATALSSFTARVRDRFHTSIPNSQVSFDVPWSPYNEKGTGIDGRNYNFTSLADATDLLFIMAYDEQSQIFGPECIARANSPYSATSGGILAYLDLGIDADKLVLGLPWYGYDYTCAKVDRSLNRCYLPEVPFRGVNCSDAAGRQVPYKDIKKIADSYGKTFDENSQSLYTFYTDKTNKTHQIWYDDPYTLSLKNSFAVYKNLRGVGVFITSDLDYSGSDEGDEMVKGMWGTFPDYKKIGKYLINHK